MSQQLSLTEALAALSDRRIVDVEIEGDECGDLIEIRLKLEGGPETLAVEIVSWGAYGADSYLNVNADGERAE